VISIIFPVYNESESLRHAVYETKKVLDNLGEDYEIILSDDGSTDGSKTIGDDLATSNNQVLNISCDKNTGKGGALKRGFKVARGDVLIFSDVDLASDITETKKLVEIIRGGADICIASRKHSKSVVERTRIRRITSIGYNGIIRLLFKTEIKDFLCGFKAFNRQMMPILLNAKNSGWSYDTEVLIKAEKKGFKIEAIPIRWRESKNSKIHLFTVIPKELIALLKLRLSML